MKGQTQKSKILELLQSGQPVSQARLRNVGEGYRDCIAELREAYRIDCTITLEGTYYSLIGERTDERTANITTGLQTA